MGMKLNQRSRPPKKHARINRIPAGRLLEERFGPLGIRILDRSEAGRVSTRSAANGTVLAYNMVVFLEAAKRDPVTHRKILSGQPIADAFQEQGHAVLRLERCSFPFELPSRLRELFGTGEKDRGSVKLVSVYMDAVEEGREYAKIIEIYSPTVGAGKEFEAESGMIDDVRKLLSSLKWNEIGLASVANGADQPLKFLQREGKILEMM